MYRLKNIKTQAWGHSMYIRRDRKSVLKFCAKLAEEQGISLSRFLTNLAEDFLDGNLQYKRSLLQGRKR